jgi:hypothetical protein
VDDDAVREAEEIIDLPHPLGVAAGEIVVDGHDMDALARERIQIDGEGRDQRLAFAGLHFGDGAFVQHHAADQLDVEMALAERPFGRLAHRGECGNQQIVERCAVFHLPAELGRARPQFVVGKLARLRSPAR